MEPREIVNTIVDVLVSTYGNLGYIDFKINSIEPNGEPNVFIVKYSFIPRNGDKKKLFYLTKIDVVNKSNFASKEIKESEL